MYFMYFRIFWLYILVAWPITKSFGITVPGSLTHLVTELGDIKIDDVIKIRHATRVLTAKVQLFAKKVTIKKWPDTDNFTMYLTIL